MDNISTRERIVSAANKLFYREGIRAVSVDAVAEEAGITKRSLYYHFKSKDDLVAAYLDYRDLPNLKAFRRWFADAAGRLEDRIGAIFDNLAEAAQHPKWKGCGFLRTSAELANMPGHPAIVVGAAHKKKIEDWLASCISAEGMENAEALARQIRLLLDGSFAVAMLHRDPSYFRTAGEAARVLVRAGRTTPATEILA
ncbi:TetR/AcrR family transcriptional regulator [Rhizobium terrae]|uniref:TetR/AcrR family transcriptional regulator n=1 Tax=Rhizobium terrae TaxID=2171756 RepID=UPI000E3C06EA|nr:TetR/AcrR family transcriptional regulator [Rhizobium terrae]